MTDIIQAMKVIKLYAWEIPFKEKIAKIRDVEISMLKNMAYYYGILASSFAITPSLVLFVCFGAYIRINSEMLTADKVFVCIALTNIIKWPLMMFPYYLSEFTKLKLSLNRIEEFLNAEELNENNWKSCNSSSNAIEIRKAYHTWSDDENTRTMKDISFDVRKGSLVGVVGPVGSGKSSLLLSMLGEIQCLSGSIRVDGKIAYVPQQPWIQNMTFRENVLFGCPFDVQKYANIIDNCALKEDLAKLANGDLAEIGGNGINISGGQKQRISLARALYSDADIYLMDDPLSAVDAKVENHIFEHAFGHKSMLRGKTRVIVTNTISHLSKMDKIIFLKYNIVSEQGTYEELVEKKGDFLAFMQEHMTTTRDSFPLENDKMVMTHNVQRDQNQQEIDSSSRIKIKTNKGENSSNIATPSRMGKLVDEEQMVAGGVKWMYFKRYLDHVGLKPCIIILCLNGLAHFFHVAENYVLMSDESRTR